MTPDPGLVCDDFDESQDFMQICKGQVAAGETSVVITLTPAPGASFGGWVTDLRRNHGDPARSP